MKQRICGVYNMMIYIYNIKILYIYIYINLGEVILYKFL